MINIRKTCYLLIALCIVAIIQGCGSNATPLDDTHGEWILNRTILDDQFLFRERLQPSIIDEETFSPYQQWGESSPYDDLLTMPGFYEMIFDMITFRDGHIYTLAYTPDTFRDGIVGWYTRVSHINYVEGFVDYNVWGSLARAFSGVDFAYHIRFCYERNLISLFYAESREHVEGLFNNLAIVQLTDDENLEVIGGTGIWQHDGQRRPLIAYSDDHIILNFVDGNAYVLGHIRYDAINLRRHGHHPFVEVLRYDFTVDENGLITGRIPIYAASDQYGIYFQVVTLDGEQLESGGVSHLYFFCFETQNHEPILHLDDSITYINGRNGVIIYNYHSIDDPSILTGRIVFLADNKSVTIPHITPVNDITYSRIEDDIIFIVTRDHLIIYDLVAERFEYFDVSSLSDRHHRSNVRVSEGQFGWLCFSDDEADIVFYRIKFKRS